MTGTLAIVTVVAGDQDGALECFSDRLGVERRRDQEFGPGEVGRDPTGSFRTADCEAACEGRRSTGVTGVHGPEQRPHGTEAVFEAPDGTRFSLLEPAGRPSGQTVLPRVPNHS